MGWWEWLNLAVIVLLLAATAAWLWERRSTRRRRSAEPDDPRVAEWAAEFAAASGAHPPVSDDIRVEAFADELFRARDESRKWNHLLIWSGPLPAVVDEDTAVNALVQTKWWHFNGHGALRAVDHEARVIKQLTWLIGNTMAYNVEVVPEARAAELAAKLVSLLPERRRWFTNFDGELGDRWASTPLTDFTFDAGFIAVAEGRAWVAWFTDED